MGQATGQKTSTAERMEFNSPAINPNFASQQA
jgi:hypothetical protein